MNIFSFFFDPVPPAVPYGDPRFFLPFLLAAGLLVAASLLSRWRRKSANAVTQKLSKSWPAAASVYGLAALVFAVSRAEGIQYLSMRFWWLLWTVFAILFVILQYRVFKARHYEVLKSERVEDPREKYLPKKKK